MNKTAQAALALLVFGLLILFFVAAWASARETVATTPGLPVATVASSATVSPLTAPNSAVNSVAPAATATPGPLISYTIQQGEWLRTIALRYNTTVDAILAVNPQITDPDLVRPGETILIPQGTP
jgi:LysM repeat protein